MKRMLTRWLKTGGCSSTFGSGAVKKQKLRLLASKASNRAAVHGSRLPATDSIDKEEVEKVIEKGKEENETKKKDIKDKVDPQMEHLENSDFPLK